MYFSKKLNILLFVLLFILLNSKSLIAFENKILFKVDNEIITSIDIYEEIQFLKTFNPELEKISFHSSSDIMDICTFISSPHE